MNENGRRALYLVAGVYLIYLGGDLVLGMLRNKADFNVFMLGAGVAFVLCGVFLTIDYIRYRKKEFMNRDMENDGSVQTIEEENVEDSKKEGEE